ncbi:5-formaminoimidazole-4-carboxamide-1-(beta)-D-ribofuranosyl 5'-monophosphate synthetase [Candidatus Peregrinibacteria bacterium CG_4_9_14_0_2_um_filter_53_11]|nr:MAG: 5-formaminoimidazole-4-carboxamide-1-(beta)-D-ribofuranosyl 5'-monophosphate synthetase [Candidatus Peregrinibacteria bacterium CG_4_9_14_0_2_um_filter_53_11]
MITDADIQEILASYKVNSPSDITIGVLGGHSALDVCAGAKKYGFKTLAVCRKGREKTYSQYYRTRDASNRAGTTIGCVDDVIVLDSFGDVLLPEVQQKLLEKKTIFVHNRYFWVYCDFEKVQNEFRVPIFGLRQGVAMEERDHPNNQYKILQKAGIRIPKIVREGGVVMEEGELRSALENHFAESESPLIVKASEATRSYERAFFVINSVDDYFTLGGKMVEEGKVTQENLKQAVIEEYVLGAHVNLNYFYSPFAGEVELMGTDTRRQTNLDGLLRLDAREQSRLLSRGFKPKMIETGHYAVTMKESLVEKALELGEKFVQTMKTEAAPGMIGPFALQGAVVAEDGREEFVIFDVSMRIPGSPGTRFTPYSGYLYGESLSVGERVALELAEGLKQGRLHELLT